MNTSKSLDLDEILAIALATAFTKGKVGVERGRISTITEPERLEALAAIVEAVEGLIGEDEASKEIREFRCPLYNECRETADYYAVTKGGTKYCTEHGRKLVLYEGMEQEGDDWVRNELRAEQRKAIKEWQ